MLPAKGGRPQEHCDAATHINLAVSHSEARTTTLLLLNPNTNVSTTEAMVNIAQDACGSSTTVMQLCQVLGRMHSGCLQILSALVRVLCRCTE